LLKKALQFAESIQNNPNKSSNLLFLNSFIIATDHNNFLLQDQWLFQVFKAINLTWSTSLCSLIVIFQLA